LQFGDVDALFAVFVCENSRAIEGAFLLLDAGASSDPLTLFSPQEGDTLSGRSCLPNL
jgi:hypothetical protein